METSKDVGVKVQVQQRLEKFQFPIERHKTFVTFYRKKVLFKTFDVKVQVNFLPEL